MLLMPLFKRVVVVSSISILLLLSACGGNYSPNAETETGEGNNPSGIQLVVPVQPTVVWKDTNKTTQMILQFSVKDGEGRPISADKFDVQMNINNQSVDVESLINQSSVDLEVNLYFGMVLDASNSMTLHNPPAFEPMKVAARDSYQEVLDLWSGRPGDVKFSAIWFDSLINQAVYSPANTSDWRPIDILSIPKPVEGSFTKLYAAVDQMAVHMKSEFDNGVMNGPRDQYVMLVFSDGADNYSWVDNSDLSSQVLTTDVGASYEQFGVMPVSLASAKQRIESHPRLTTHVIGLGSAIKADELLQLATAGHGVFLSNPSSENVAALFQQVMKEFTTLQTQGLEVPLQPALDEYKISLVVTNSDTGDTDYYDFYVRVGDESAVLVE